MFSGIDPKYQILLCNGSGNRKDFKCGSNLMIEFVNDLVGTTPDESILTTTAAYKDRKILASTLKPTGNVVKNSISHSYSARRSFPLALLPEDIKTIINEGNFDSLPLFWRLRLTIENDTPVVQLNNFEYIYCALFGAFKNNFYVSNPLGLFIVYLTSFISIFQTPVNMFLYSSFTTQTLTLSCSAVLAILLSLIFNRTFALTALFVIVTCMMLSFVIFRYRIFNEVSSATISHILQEILEDAERNKHKLTATNTVGETTNVDINELIAKNTSFSIYEPVTEYDTLITIASFYLLDNKAAAHSSKLISTLMSPLNVSLNSANDEPKFISYHPTSVSEGLEPAHYVRVPPPTVFHSPHALALVAVPLLYQLIKNATEYKRIDSLKEALIAWTKINDPEFHHQGGNKSLTVAEKFPPLYPLELPTYEIVFSKSIPLLLSLDDKYVGLAVSIIKNFCKTKDNLEQLRNMKKDIGPSWDVALLVSRCSEHATENCDTIWPNTLLNYQELQATISLPFKQNYTIFITSLPILRHLNPLSYFTSASYRKGLELLDQGKEAHPSPTSQIKNSNYDYVVNDLTNNSTSYLESKVMMSATPESFIALCDDSFVNEYEYAPIVAATNALSKYIENKVNMKINLRVLANKTLVRCVGVYIIAHISYAVFFK